MTMMVAILEPQTLQYQYIIASEHLNVLCNTILCSTDACTVQNIDTE